MHRPLFRSSHGKRLALAGELAVARMGLGPEVACEMIAGEARSASSLWHDRPERVVHWDWPSLSLDFQNVHPKCFSAAIWYETVLCGLALGIVDDRKFVALDFLEGNPDPAHPLKGWIVPIVLTMAEAYRRLIGVPELRLHEVDPALIPLYGGMGFTLAPYLGNPHHMIRRASDV